MLEFLRFALCAALTLCGLVALISGVVGVFRFHYALSRLHAAAARHGRKGFPGFAARIAQSPSSGRGFAVHLSACHVDIARRVVGRTAVVHRLG